MEKKSGINKSSLFFKSKFKLFNFSHNSLKTNLELSTMYYGPLQ